jgi:Mg2+ and Co2+ transporter CorA
MTQFTWESEAGAEAQAAPQPVAPAAEPESIALSVDEFSALEDRILRAVNLVKRERHARAEAVERAALADAKLSEQATLVEQLQKEVSTLRSERDHVRQRVERLLSQLDTLEL